MQPLHLNFVNKKSFNSSIKNKKKARNNLRNWNLHFQPLSIDFNAFEQQQNYN